LRIGDENSSYEEVAPPGSPPRSDIAQDGPCHVITSANPIPSGFGASYNLFSTQKELLVATVCEGTTVKVTAGNGSDLTYVYDTGYLYKNSAWQAYTLECSGKTGSWCPKQATATIPNAPQDTYNYLVAYTCQWLSNSWKCGCDSTSCVTPKWQLQAYTR
jgi:hypothetical protein